jgi:Zn-finger domain-containing protein
MYIQTHSSYYSNLRNYRAGAVTESQASVLNDLISKGNAALRRIFIAYEKDKDVYKLIDSLKKMNIAKVRRLHSKEQLSSQELLFTVSSSS